MDDMIRPVDRILRKRHRSRNVGVGYVAPITWITALHRVGCQCADLSQIRWKFDARLLERLYKLLKIVGKGKLDPAEKEDRLERLFDGLLCVKADLFRQYILPHPQLCQLLVASGMSQPVVRRRGDTLLRPLIHRPPSRFAGFHDR